MNLKELKYDASNCKQCTISASRKCAVFSRGTPVNDIVVCGMAPAKEENEEGKPFIGRSGKILNRVLSETCIDPYITNLVKCFVPAKVKLEKEWICNCKGYLFKQIDIIKPKIVIALGKDVSNTLCNNKVSLKSIRGKIIKADNFYVLPTYHPSYLGRTKEANIDTMINDFIKAITFNK